MKPSKYQKALYDSYNGDKKLYNQMLNRVKKDMVLDQLSEIPIENKKARKKLLDHMEKDLGFNIKRMGVRKYI